MEEQNDPSVAIPPQSSTHYDGISAPAPREMLVSIPYMPSDIILEILDRLCAEIQLAEKKTTNAQQCIIALQQCCLTPKTFKYLAQPALFTVSGKILGLHSFPRPLQRPHNVRIQRPRHDQTLRLLRTMFERKDLAEKITVLNAYRAQDFPGIEYHNGRLLLQNGHNDSNPWYGECKVAMQHIFNIKAPKLDPECNMTKCKGSHRKASHPYDYVLDLNRMASSWPLQHIFSRQELVVLLNKVYAHEFPMKSMFIRAVLDSYANATHLLLALTLPNLQKLTLRLEPKQREFTKRFFKRAAKDGYKTFRNLREANACIPGHSCAAVVESYFLQLPRIDSVKVGRFGDELSMQLSIPFDTSTLIPLAHRSNVTEIDVDGTFPMQYIQRMLNCPKRIDVLCVTHVPAHAPIGFTEPDDGNYIATVMKIAEPHKEYLQILMVGCELCCHKCDHIMDLSGFKMLGGLILDARNLGLEDDLNGNGSFIANMLPSQLQRLGIGYGPGYGRSENSSRLRDRLLPNHLLDNLTALANYLKRNMMASSQSNEASPVLSDLEEVILSRHGLTVEIDSDTSEAELVNVYDPDNNPTEREIMCEKFGTEVEGLKRLEQVFADAGVEFVFETCSDICKQGEEFSAIGMCLPDEYLRTKIARC